MLCVKEVRSLLSLCQVRSAVVGVFSLFKCFWISVLQYACMPVIQGRVALVCVMPVIFWVRAQVRSGHGQVDVGEKKRNFN